MVSSFFVKIKVTSQQQSEVQAYSELMGSVVKWQKCSGLWYEAWATNSDVFENINFTLTPPMYLGVFLQDYKRPNAYWSSLVQTTREAAG